MKNLFYALPLLCLATLFVLSCSKSEDNAYIKECEHITRNTYPDITDRSLACKNCCKENGWDSGFYNLPASSVKEGCECFDN